MPEDIRVQSASGCLLTLTSSKLLSPPVPKDLFGLCIRMHHDMNLQPPLSNKAQGLTHRSFLSASVLPVYVLKESYV